jgi:hypothetical protein
MILGARGGALNMEIAMAVDINRLSNQLAANRSITDYDFWRASKTINDALYLLEKHGSPIPMEVIQVRRIIKQARLKRTSVKASR